MRCARATSGRRSSREALPAAARQFCYLHPDDVRWAAAEGELETIVAPADGDRRSTRRSLVARQPVWHPCGSTRGHGRQGALRRCSDRAQCHELISRRPRRAPPSDGDVLRLGRIHGPVGAHGLRGFARAYLGLDGWCISGIPGRATVSLTADDVEVPRTCSMFCTSRQCSPRRLVRQGVVPDCAVLRPAQ